MIIPDTIDGLPVTRIGNSVTRIGDTAFGYCTSLTGVYFKGNPPDLAFHVFEELDKTIIYYLPETTGWGSTFGGRAAVLWLPRAQAPGVNFGLPPNHFGFNIEWASGKMVVVEASTNLSNPDWQPVQTIPLTTGAFHFSDPEWAAYPGRFYRLRSL